MSVGIGMVTVENTLLQSCKAIQISRTSNWESPNAETVDTGQTGWIGVCPCQVVFRAGSDDFHFVILGQKFRY